MTVDEVSLYADLHVETSPVQTTAVWTDHIADVRDVSLSRGGYEPYIGVNQVETGSGTITLVNNTATIEPGYWVRVRYSSTNIWAGFVQDVTTNYRFIEGTEYAVKTLIVLDWVAWVAQYSFSSYPAINGGAWWNRLADINLLIDPTGANKPLVEYPTGTAASWRFPEYVGQASVAEILDLHCNSVKGAYWKANTTVPTGSASGIDSLVTMFTSTVTSSGNLTDGTHTGSPTPLGYYSEIEMVTQTSAVVNNAVIANNFENDGEMATTEYQRSDSTSIATYGSRLATIQTSVWGSPVVNLSTMPSFENVDYELTSTNFYTSVEQPALDAGGAWAAYSGSKALRAYNLAGTGTNTSQGWDERISVTAGTTYYAIAYAATTGSGSIRARTRIDWYNEANTLLSTTFGSFVSLSSFKTWYKTTTSGTAPANSSFARVTVYFDRGGASSFVATTKLWVDGVYFGTTNVSDWFDGNSTDTATYLYGWYGGDDTSQSFRITNYLHTLAGDFLTDNKTPKYSPLKVRLNAQTNLTIAAGLDLYESIQVWRDSHRWSTLVTGLNHNITVNPDGTTRWMIDVIVRPSTYTI